MLQVADLMTADPICRHPDDTLWDAWSDMEEGRLRHLPVVDEDGNLIGLLSHRDLVRHALAGLEDVPMSRVREYLSRLSIESAMVGEPESASADDAASDAAQRMFESKFGCLPVTEGLKVVGILTESDFVRYVAQRDG